MEELDALYYCFCDVFASNGYGVAYVYHDGNKRDYYVEGKLEESEIISNEEYNKEYEEFIKRNKE